MSFSDAQLRQLKAPVRRRHVKERQADGKTLHYLEGWWVVSEANRIFGFDSWERETVSSECVWRNPVDGQFAAAYLTRVRLRVRAGDKVIVREGLGAGEAIASTPGQAHERASKAAETDATKRALSTFGSRFGLSLYGERSDAAKVPYERVPLGRAAARVIKDVGDRMRATAKRESADVESRPRADRDPGPISVGSNGHADDAGWRKTRGAHPFTRGPAPELPNTPEAPPPRAAPKVGSLVEGAAPESTPGSLQDDQSGRLTDRQDNEVTSVLSATGASELPLFQADDSGPNALLPVRVSSSTEPPRLTGRVDKSVLTLSEPRRIRDRHHLKFVATQPCLVCARTPSQAHHLRIAQPRALGRKVSDEFTVPLCALHHHDLHNKGNEAEWWWGHAIDPLPIAERLWSAHRGSLGSACPSSVSHAGSQRNEGSRSAR